MLRADWELARPASAEIEQKLIDAILPQLARADIVLLSDYAKGVLTARVIRNIIDAARNRQAGHRRSQERQLCHLSRRDAADAQPKGIRRRRPAAAPTRRSSIAIAAQDAMQLADCEAMLVTQSEHGMTLVPRTGDVVHIPAHPVKSATSPARATPSPRCSR